MELSVTITNVKNQPPQWEKESYTVVIPENTVRDTPVVVHTSGGGAGGRHCGARGCFFWGICVIFQIYPGILNLFGFYSFYSHWASD